MLLRKGYILARILRRPWWPAERLRHHRDRRLAHIIRHAYENVPYYSARFSGLELEERPSGGALELVRRLPITHKADLAGLELRERIARDRSPERMIVFRSSGSTGEPFLIPTDPHMYDLRGASIIRTYLAHRLWPGSAVALFAIPQGHDSHRPSRFSAFRRVRMPVLGSHGAQIEALQRMNAPVYEGYPSFLTEIATTVLERGITNLRPQAVLTNSEQLTDTGRDVIRQAFGCDPINVYDAWEFGNVAWQCPERDGFHVNADLLHVEILVDGDPAPPGEPGDIVVTDLYNTSAPLIRYALRDIGVLDDEPCPCGRGLPLLARIDGRTAEHFVRADGSRIAATPTLCTVMREYPRVTAFQGMQRVPGILELVIDAPPSAFDSTAESHVVEALKRELAIASVEVIRGVVRARGPGGKVLPFVCEIPADARMNDPAPAGSSPPRGRDTARAKST